MFGRNDSLEATAMHLKAEEIWRGAIQWICSKNLQRVMLKLEHGSVNKVCSNACCYSAFFPKGIHQQILGKLRLSNFHLRYNIKMLA